MSPDMFKNMYGMDIKDALVPLSQPGLVTIPLSFAAIVVASLLTSKSHGLYRHES